MSNKIYSNKANLASTFTTVYSRASYITKLALSVLKLALSVLTSPVKFLLKSINSNDKVQKKTFFGKKINLATNLIATYNIKLITALAVCATGIVLVKDKGYLKEFIRYIQKIFSEDSTVQKQSVKILKNSKEKLLNGKIVLNSTDTFGLKKVFEQVFKSNILTSLMRYVAITSAKEDTTCLIEKVRTPISKLYSTLFAHYYTSNLKRALMPYVSSIYKLSDLPINNSSRQVTKSIKAMFPQIIANVATSKKLFTERSEISSTVINGASLVSEFYEEYFSREAICPLTDNQPKLFDKIANLLNQGMLGLDNYVIIPINALINYPNKLEDIIVSGKDLSSQIVNYGKKFIEDPKVHTQYLATKVSNKSILYFRFFKGTITDIKEWKKVLSSPISIMNFIIMILLGKLKSKKKSKENEALKSELKTLKTNYAEFQSQNLRPPSAPVGPPLPAPVGGPPLPAPVGGPPLPASVGPPPPPPGLLETLNKSQRSAKRFIDFSELNQVRLQEPKRKSERKPENCLDFSTIKGRRQVPMSAFSHLENKGNSSNSESQNFIDSLRRVNRSTLDNLNNDDGSDNDNRFNDSSSTSGNSKNELSELQRKLAVRRKAIDPEEEN